MLFLARYVIIIIGITISFAGSPRIKARIITPSSPSSCPKGSRVFAMFIKRLVSFIVVFDSIHIIKPAGAEA